MFDTVREFLTKLIKLIMKIKFLENRLRLFLSKLFNLDISLI
jgi:hypothetical protein